MGTATQECSQLQEWAMAHEPDEKLTHKDGYWNQIIFVRDIIAQVLATTYKECETIQAKMQAVSTHTSKSVQLPVFKVELTDGTTFIMRYNFHDWKVSVSSPRDVKADFMGLFDPNDSIHEAYCEGFPEGTIYGPLSVNKRQFTIALPPGNHHLFTFFWIFAHQVLGNKNKQGRGR